MAINKATLAKEVDGKREYIYTKTTGTGDIKELPPQTGVNANNLYEYLLLISMILLSLKGYKKVKETL